jgi:hypothetical protein
MSARPQEVTLAPALQCSFGREGAETDSRITIFAFSTLTHDFYERRASCAR